MVLVNFFLEEIFMILRISLFCINNDPSFSLFEFSRLFLYPWKYLKTVFEIWPEICNFIGWYLIDLKITVRFCFIRIYVLKIVFCPKFSCNLRKSTWGILGYFYIWGQISKSIKLVKMCVEMKSLLRSSKVKIHEKK